MADDEKWFKDQISNGNLHLIANETERMAKMNENLTSERDKYWVAWRERGEQIERLERANAALRGHLKRAKRKAVGNG